MDIRKKSISGIRWTTITNVTVAILYLAKLSILGRFLSKEEFGLASLAMVILGFVQGFVDMGLSNAIIHSQSVEKKHLDTMYWLNFIAGGIFFLVLNILAPFIASFYQHQELETLFRGISLAFLVQPMGLQFKVLLQKELEFYPIAVAEIVGAFLGVVSAFFMAKAGMGAKALVYSFLLSTTVASIIFLFMGLKTNKPSLYFKLSEVGPFLKFGLFQMGEKSINYFNTQFDVLVIGKVLGTEVVGVYNIAKQLVMRPAAIINPIITRVTFPAMAKIQNDELRLKKAYLKTLNYLSSINFLVYAGIFVLAPEVIQIFFGKGWTDAVGILRVLCIFAAIRSTGNPVGSLLLARGYASLGFYWNLGLFFIIPVVVYVGSLWGIYGVCWSLVALSTVLIMPNWRVQVYPLCNAGFNEYHKQILVPLITATISGAFAFYVLKWFDGMLLRIVVASFVGVVMGFVLNWFFNRSFVQTLMELALFRKRN